MGKLKSIDFILFVAAVSSFIVLNSSCTFEAKGIPVKDYTPSISVEDLHAKEEMEKEIRALSRVTENSVFTEKRGIPEYIIGPGDVLTINFWEGTTVTPYIASVRPDGRISYSFVDNILVSGHTAFEVVELLTEALKKYIKEPRLEVYVKEYKSKSALLFGQINVLQQGISGPGKYPLTGKTSILDLIVSAGGPITGRSSGVYGTVSTAMITGGQIPEAANADLRNVELVRRGKKYTVNLYNAMFRGDMSHNVILDDGDIITVPELPTFGERVFVFGEVAFQGIYRLKDAHDLLASLSLAGGVTRTAIKQDIKIIREYKERQRKPLILSADLDQILKQGDLAQNITLQNGDVVYVPRRVIGDINEFILNTTPLLEYLLYPGTFRNMYSNEKYMRFTY